MVGDAVGFDKVLPDAAEFDEAPLDAAGFDEIVVGAAGVLVGDLVILGDCDCDVTPLIDCVGDDCSLLASPLLPTTGDGSSATSSRAIFLAVRDIDSTYRVVSVASDVYSRISLTASAGSAILRQ